MRKNIITYDKLRYLSAAWIQGGTSETQADSAGTTVRQGQRKNLERNA